MRVACDRSEGDTDGVRRPPSSERIGGPQPCPRVNQKRTWMSHQWHVDGPSTSLTNYTRTYALILSPTCNCDPSLSVRPSEATAGGAGGVKSFFAAATPLLNAFALLLFSTTKQKEEERQGEREKERKGSTTTTAAAAAAVAVAVAAAAVTAVLAPTLPMNSRKAKHKNRTYAAVRAALQQQHAITTAQEGIRIPVRVGGACLNSKS